VSRTPAYPPLLAKAQRVTFQNPSSSDWAWFGDRALLLRTVRSGSHYQLFTIRNSDTSVAPFAEPTDFAGLRNFRRIFTNYFTGDQRAGRHIDRGTELFSA